METAAAHTNPVSEKKSAHHWDGLTDQWRTKKTTWCDPYHLEIKVYDDRQCTEYNDELTHLAQLSDTQKAKFEHCQLLSP